MWQCTPPTVGFAHYFGNSIIRLLNSADYEICIITRIADIYDLAV